MGQAGLQQHLQGKMLIFSGANLDQKVEEAGQEGEKDTCSAA